MSRRTVSSCVLCAFALAPAAFAADPTDDFSFIFRIGGGEQVVKSSDPLDGRYGTEEWNAEDKGGKRRTKEKKAKNGDDPLDGVNGTEDW